MGKNSYGMIKIPIKIMEEEDVIWNNFCNCNLLRFSTYLELNTRFQVKAVLTRFAPVCLLYYSPLFKDTAMFCRPCGSIDSLPPLRNS
jgi:hypothetical protein